MKHKKFTLKLLMVPAAFCLLAAAVLLIYYFNKDTAKSSAEITNYSHTEYKGEYVLENESLKFIMDAESTQFSVMKKDTETVWYSNPGDSDSDPLALAAEKNNLKSTLLITYDTEKGVKTLYNNFEYSVKRDIYSIEAADGYIRVNYSIGNVGKTYIIPSSIPESQMNRYLEKMDASWQKQVKNYYRKIDRNKLQATDNKEELLSKYPDLETECVYVLRETTKDYLKEKLQEYFAAAGFTEEDLEEDSQNGAAGMFFNVSVIYRLDGDQLVVEVPMEDIRYNPEYPVTSVTVLPFLGAGGIEDSGYLFVPEGGGAIINFNNGKIAQSPYVSNLYGWDDAVSRTELVHETKNNFPVFGIAKNGSSLLCIMEDGASYGRLTADISGRNNSYNSVSATYTTVHAESYNVAGKSNEPVYVFEKNPPEENIIQRYYFIDSDNYMDMAQTYQEYLVNKYPGMDRKMDTSTPVVVEIVGAIDKVKHRMGFPVSVPVALTTYKEAGELAGRLKKDGFENLSVKYTGWMNGGVNQSILTGTRLISELGGKTGLKNLLGYAEENGIPFYLDGITQIAKNSGLSDGFMVSRDAARFASKEEAKLGEFSAIWYGIKENEESCYLLKPEVIQKMVSNLKNAALDYGAYGVSLQDVGNTLSSDLYEKELVTREQSIKMEQASMEEIKKDGLGIIINNGNAYAVSYADFITNMDLFGSDYSIIDRSVPVYQIALHGYVNYSGNAVNLSDNYEELILKSAETGAGLYFTFMKEAATVLQNSPYTCYFGADFSKWEEDAKEIYYKYNNAFKNLYNQKITDHYYAAEKVTVTTYEDGTKVYVNYGTTEYKEGRITVGARSYAVEKND
ncbi:DUF5696 domain-containing protein [Anaerocolumna jejuensis]|uniref:DUF5696 domain-containing protein n=1 Tax=Anaerocolumna jejuensis TaxID=259063 RepID=UPI003F7CCB00